MSTTGRPRRSTIDRNTVLEAEALAHDEEVDAQRTAIEVEDQEFDESQKKREQEDEDYQLSQSSETYGSSQILTVTNSYEDDDEDMGRDSGSDDGESDSEDSEDDASDAEPEWVAPSSSPPVRRVQVVIQYLDPDTEDVIDEDQPTHPWPSGW